MQLVKPRLTAFLKRHLGGRFPAEIKALELWDCEWGKDSTEAGLFGLFEMQFHRLLMKSVESEKDRLTLINHLYLDHFIFRAFNQSTSESYRFRKEDQVVCSNSSSFLPNNPCGDAILVAFEKAAREWGSRSWGSLHHRLYKHSVFGDSPLAFIFNSRHPFGGNARTPNVATYGSHKKQDGYFDAIIGASFRLVTDLNQTYWMLDTGIGENSFSGANRRLIDMFLAGEYIRYTPGQIAGAQSVTRLHRD